MHRHLHIAGSECTTVKDSCKDRDERSFENSGMANVTAFVPRRRTPLGRVMAPPPDPGNGGIDGALPDDDPGPSVA